MGKIKSIATCLFLAGAFLVRPQNSRAAVYYTSTAGNNSNPGTIASPFLTIARGLTALAPGDTLYVRAGNYSETFTGGIPSGTSASSPITLMAYPGETVTLKPASAANLFKIDTASFFTINGFIMDGTNVTESIVFLGNATAASAHNIIIENSTIKNSPGDGGLETELSENNSFLYDQIYNNGGTNPKNHGLYLDGDGNTIDHCNIYGNGGLGINLYNGYVGGHTNNDVVSNNTIHDNSSAAAGRWGLGIASGSGTLAFNNVFWNNGGGIDVGENDGTTPTTGARIYNNTIYNNSVGGSGYGIYLNLNASGSVVQNNIVYDNSAGAIVNGGETGTTITNNLTVNPTFVNAAALNFALLAGSPAIDAGITIPAVTADIIGTHRPQGAAYDIGAYEYIGTTKAAAPVITAVSASGISPTAATIAWTTNVTADSQVEYGLTTTYGSLTPLSSALTTSHSVALSGLTAGTLYHYAVLSHNSAGTLATSPDATFTTTANTVPPGCVLSTASVWQNVALAAQTGSFTAAFTATPGLANEDGIMGFSNGAAAAFTSQAAAVRFNNTGTIDARNAGAYAAAASIPYVAGLSYTFSLVVNLPTHTYSAYVTQGSNAKQTIGLNYAFRTEQAAAATLNDLGVFADVGSVTACNPTVTASAPPTVISAVATTGVGPTVATIGWTTNNPADTQVHYGPTTAYGVTSTLVATPVTSHSVALGGLTASTVYHYQVMSRDGGGNLITSPDATFTTSAAVVAPPPVISAVSATGIGPTSATITWTTSEAANGQVDFGLTTAYGSLTPLSTALTTSHSVALSGLTAGTVYHYVVGSQGAAGAIATSPDATFTAAASGPPPGCVVSAANAWQNVPITSEAGTFTASFDATPSVAKEDGVSGLSNGAASAFTSQAAIVRFNDTGTIDARNGGVYAAASSIPYTAGTSYHFQLVVNMKAHTYSAYVTPASGAQQTIGLNYAFRTEQKAATLLNNLGVVDDTIGSVTVCNVVP